jgi:hypothetical protein
MISTPRRESSRRPLGSDLLTLTRARLYDRLERAADFPVLVVAAPPGFGKTTVLRRFFAAQDRPHRNVQLGPSGADAAGFARALTTGLADLAPGLPTLLAAVGSDDRSNCGERIADEIAAALAGQLQGRRLTLIVDGPPGITEALSGLLTALVDRTSSDELHWVLVSETANHLPIARWLANDRMDMPIDDVDLAITYEDLVAAVDAARAPVAHATLRNISKASAGWPASVALALADAAGSWVATREVMPRTRSYAYFAEHAFAARSQAEQRLLLETCVYPELDGELLSVAGWTHAAQLFARLSDADVLLFAAASGTFCYHECFAAFLQQRLQAGSGEGYRRVCRAAAFVYERLGRWSDALELHLRSQAALAVAELLSGHGFDLLDRGEAELVQRALGLLNDVEFSAFPVALAVKASLESLRGSFDLAEAWFVHALELAGDSRLRGSIVFRLATDLVRRDRREAIDLLEPIVAAGGHERGLAVSLAGLLATAYATHGETAAAASTIELALQQLADVADPAVRAKLYFQAGYVAFFGRDAVQAKGFAQQAVWTATAARLYDIAARALSILFNIARDYEDDVGAARHYLDELKACSIKAGSRNLVVYATLAQFELEVFRGDLEQSARHEAALQSLEVGYSLLATETLLPALALRATWSGDFARAYRLLASSAENQITPGRQAQRYAEIALYAAAAGLRGAACAAVRRALAIAATQDDADASLGCMRAYVALALNVLGRHRRAAQVLSTLDRSTFKTPRFAQLRDAVAAISERWEHGRYSADLGDILERLGACDFGGIGRLIEALPLPASFDESYSSNRPRTVAGGAANPANVR